MAQVNVTISGKTYRMACEDGQEEHLFRLAERVGGVIEKFRGEFGEIGDQRLTVMAAIALADQASETERRVARLEAEIANIQETRVAALASAEEIESGVAQTIEQVAGRIEAIARRISNSPPDNGAG